MFRASSFESHKAPTDDVCPGAGESDEALRRKTGCRRGESTPRGWCVSRPARTDGRQQEHHSPDDPGAAPADEIALATRYLSGSLRQRRTGIELSTLSQLPSPEDAGGVSLAELDTVMQRASQMAGAGSSRQLAELFLPLFSRLTAEERVLDGGLLRGGRLTEGPRRTAPALPGCRVPTWLVHEPLRLTGSGYRSRR